MEKGALGLFFELNYLIGMFLTGYIAWFITKYKATDIIPTLAANATDAQKGLNGDFKNMYNWLYFHFIYIFVSIFIIIVVNFIYINMDKKAKSLKPAKVHREDNAASAPSASIN